MQIENNPLTKNEKYIYLLHIIGKSPKHVSISDIKKSMSKADIVRNEQQIYEMIEKLNSFLLEEYGICLLKWNKITKDMKQQKKTLEILKEYFKLDWMQDYDEKNIVHIKPISVNFEKISEKEIFIKNTRDPDRLIKIIKDEFGIIGKLIIVSQGNEETVINLYRKGDFLYLSSYDLKSKNQIKTVGYFYKDPARFLHTKLEDNSENEIRRLFERIDILEKQQKEKFSLNSQSEIEVDKLYKQIQAITQNRKLFRHHLNIRGFLLYIVGESNLEKKEKKNHNRRIESVLENLSLHYKNHFPFLEFYNNFRKEFIKINDKNLKYRYLEVELIKEIARDLNNQLQNADINFLKYYVTKKYSITIVYNILEIIKLDLLLTNSELENMIKEYQIKNFKYLTIYLNKEKKIIEEHYNFLSNNQTNSEIINKTNSFLNIYFQINQQY